MRRVFRIGPVFGVVVPRLFLFALSASAAQAQFAITETTTGLAVLEKGKPIFGYHFVASLPHSHFVHPLFDTFGNELTVYSRSGDPTARGLFWAWTDVETPGGRLNLVTSEGGRREFERIVRVDSNNETAVVAIQNAWIAGEAPRGQVLESAEYVLYPGEFRGRNIDLRLSLTNVADGPISLNPDGANGLMIALDSTRAPFTVSTVAGAADAVGQAVVSPWIDASFKLPRTFRYGGMAIFQHPDNPGYPETAWSVNADGFVATRWPAAAPFSMAPGETVEFRFRIHIHSGFGPEINLAAMNGDYLASIDHSRTPAEDPR